MARNARLVEPGTLFHITQRGNNHQEVFLSPSDRAVYLQLAHAHFADCALSLLAYCLMTNHVHWLVRPARPDSMAIFFRRVHGRYAQYLNTRCGLSGHLSPWSLLHLSPGRQSPLGRPPLGRAQRASAPAWSTPQPTGRPSFCKNVTATEG